MQLLFWAGVMGNNPGWDTSRKFKPFLLFGKFGSFFSLTSDNTSPPVEAV